MTRTALAACAAAAATASLLLAVPALAESPAPEQASAGPPPKGRLDAAERTAGDILSQPVRDVGLMGANVPDVLARASRNPYALPEASDCEAINSEIGELDTSLGPEPLAAAGRRENRVGRLAAASGRAVVNSIIPFRTVVREVSGAAPAQRRLQEAIDLGYARRGFLRGVYQMRNCPSAFDSRS